ncbi:hypothetical protein Nmel_016010 [Mimus melanotis]
MTKEGGDEDNGRERNHPHLPHLPASSAQQATSERPQNTPNKAWLQRILVIFNVFFLGLVSKLLPGSFITCEGLQIAI